MTRANVDNLLTFHLLTHLHKMVRNMDKMMIGSYMKKMGRKKNPKKKSQSSTWSVSLKPGGGGDEEYEVESIGPHLVRTSMSSVGINFDAMKGEYVWRTWWTDGSSTLEPYESFIHEGVISEKFKAAILEDFDVKTNDEIIHMFENGKELDHEKNPSALQRSSRAPNVGRRIPHVATLKSKGTWSDDEDQDEDDDDEDQDEDDDDEDQDEDDDDEDQDEDDAVAPVPVPVQADPYRFDPRPPLPITTASRLSCMGSVKEARPPRVVKRRLRMESELMPFNSPGRKECTVVDTWPY
jgi:hypothetical protein